MNRNLMWRGIMILLVVVVAALSAYPLQEKLKLGLDLKGGIHLVLRVKAEDALKAETQKDYTRLVRELQEAGVTTAAAVGVDETHFDVTGVPNDRRNDVETAVEDYLPGWKWRADGDRLRFTMEPQNAAEIRNLAVIQARETIRNRVDAFGVAEPVILRQGGDSDRLVVQLPGVDDPERVKRLIKNTALLEFHIVDYPRQGGGAGSREEVVANYGGRVPPSVKIVDGDIRDADGNTVGQQWYGLESTPVITGRELKNARPTLGEFNEPVVGFSLTHEGGQRFGEVTGANVGRNLAIVLDDRVVTAPRLNSRIADEGLIEGGFDTQEATDLATVLRSGALPAGIVTLEERTVGPSLGRDSIQSGLRAGLIGLGLVVLLMFVVYKLTGINAVVALSMNMVVVFGVLAYFKATLTLPGIAGLVLTIGMAVDANVLIFERIREELRRGRTVKSAVDSGFRKALSSVLDANITTLIASLFLFQFGTGPIRGFAVTLSIGILSSLFTALFVSRWLFDLILSRRGRVERLSI